MEEKTLSQPELAALIHKKFLEIKYLAGEGFHNLSIHNFDGIGQLDDTWEISCIKVNTEITIVAKKDDVTLFSKGKIC